MYFQKTTLRIITIILCTFILIMSVLNYPITAHASTTGAVSVNKVFDMALSKAGVVASPSTLNSIKDYLYSIMLDYGDTYLQYLKDNNLENNPENCQAFFKLQDYTDCPEWVEDICCSYTMAQFISDYYSFFDEQIEENIVNDTNLLSFLGLKDAVRGATYSIGSDFVNLLKLIFEKKTVDEMGYYYLPSYKFGDLSATLFSSPDNMNKLRSLYETIGSNYLFLSVGINGALQIYGTANGTYLIDAVKLGLTSENSKYIASVSVYSPQWSQLGIHFASYNAYTDYETFISGTSTLAKRYIDIQPMGSTNNGFVILTSDGRNVLVFNSMDAMKLYTTEQAPYYTTRDYGTYSTTNDNSITYTGDYMIEYGDTSTYGDITTNNDYSQDTIDNSVTYITNNYNYATPEGDGGNSGGSGGGNGDGGGNIWDGLTSIIDGITSFLNFILTSCGDIITLLSNFLSTAFDMITGFAETFAGFADFIGELFYFLPQEIIDLLKAGITITIVLAVVRSFMK